MDFIGWLFIQIIMTNTKKLQITAFLGGLYFYIPIFALYFSDHGVLISSVIFSQVLYSVFSFFGEIPTGMLADRFGQKNSIVAGYLLEALAVWLLLFFPTTIWLYISYSLRWIASACMSGSEEALWYESCKVEKKNYKQFSSSCHSLALIWTTIATAVAGLVLQYFGSSSYELLLCWTFVSLFCVFVISLSLVSYGEYSEIIPTPKQLLQQTYKLVTSNDIIRTLVLVSLLTLNGQYFLQGVYSLQFESVWLIPLWTGLALTIGGVLNIIATKYMYLLEKYLSYEKILLAINVLIGVGYLMTAGGSAYVMLAWFMLSWWLFNSHHSVTSDYINQEIDSSMRSTALSSMSFVRTGANIIAKAALWALVWLVWISMTLYVQWAYLLIGIAISYWLLVRCGCFNKIEKHVIQ